MVGLAILIFVASLHGSYASYGDRLEFYQRCSRNCYSSECHGTLDGFLPHYPTYNRILHWDCFDECQYNCMWKTVDELANASKAKSQQRIIPQFHGKWPFVRAFGMQEPASCVFSVANAVAHLIMVIYFVRCANREYELFYIVIAAAFVNIHGWMWSSVFHARDLPFTEKMDYFCALGIVLSNFLLAALRLIGVSWLKFGGVLAPLLAFYARHIYLMTQHFDYGYNMQVNVTWVILGAVLWLSFAGYAYFVRKQHHTRLCLLVWLCLSAAGMLELFDFPPIAWTFDAHALWHLATVPMTFVWYSFLLQDSFVAQISKSETPSDENETAGANND